MKSNQALAADHKNPRPLKSDVSRKKGACWKMKEEEMRVIPSSIKLVAGRTGQEYNLRKKRK